MSGVGPSNNRRQIAPTRHDRELDGYSSSSVRSSKAATHGSRACPRFRAAATTSGGKVSAAASSLCPPISRNQSACMVATGTFRHTAYNSKARSISPLATKTRAAAKRDTARDNTVRVARHIRCASLAHSCPKITSSCPSAARLRCPSAWPSSSGRTSLRKMATLACKCGSASVYERSHSAQQDFALGATKNTRDRQRPCRHNLGGGPTHSTSASPAQLPTSRQTSAQCVSYSAPPAWRDQKAAPDERTRGCAPGSRGQPFPES